jgi:hypothetical protein
MKMRRDLRNSRSARPQPRQDQQHAAPDAEGKLPPELVAMVQSLQGKSQDELTKMFQQTVQQQMQQGTFDKDAIMQMVGRLGPMMSAEQRERMLGMLRSLPAWD